MGSFASFTCGMLHNNGGFAAESGSPADNNFFVGFKNQDNKIHYLPFFKSTKSDAERYVQENQAQNLEGFIYKEKDINRSYEWATDAFSTDQIQFKIQTPFFDRKCAKIDPRGVPRGQKSIFGRKIESSFFDPK